MKRPQLILVLGMHRSGTSTLTRALPVLGVDIGQLHLARLDNPRGFFEHPQFVEINERLLQALGGDWKSHTPFPMEAFSRLLSSSLAPFAHDFLQRFCEPESLKGLKDPRASRLLPFWRPLCEALHIDLSVLLVLRHPTNVARSLAKRDGVDVLHASALWIRYTCEALRYSRGLPRLLVSYDRLMERPRRELERVAKFLGLTVDDTAYHVFVQQFLDQGLRHHRESGSGGGMDASQVLYAHLLPLTEGLASDALESPRLQRALFAAQESLV